MILASGSIEASWYWRILPRLSPGASLSCVSYAASVVRWHVRLTRLVVNLVLTRLDYCNAVLAGLPSCHLNRLQSVIITAGDLVLSYCQTDHITALLMDLHWLCAPERIEFKLCTLACCCVNGTSPPYLYDSIQQVSDIEAQRQLRLALTWHLVVPDTHCSMLGDGTLPVAAAHAWNALPSSIHISLAAFWRLLKKHL